MPTSTTNNRSFSTDACQEVRGACRLPTTRSRMRSAVLSVFGSNQIKASEEKPCVTAVHRSRARREERDTLILAACALGTRRKYRGKVQKTHRDLFGNLLENCHKVNEDGFDKPFEAKPSLSTLFCVSSPPSTKELASTCTLAITES